MLLALPLVFLLFSLDEVAELHEHLGILSDVFLPNWHQIDSPAPHRAVLPGPFSGIPFVIVFVGLLAAGARTSPYTAAFTKVAGGTAPFILAAVALDALAVEPHDRWDACRDDPAADRGSAHGDGGGDDRSGGARRTEPGSGATDRGVLP